MRNLPTPMIAQITSNEVMPVVLADLAFKSGTVYVWSGLGSVVCNGHTYVGVGSLGQVGDIKEGVQVKADGTSVSLSGIDPTILNDCLDDIQLGAPATLWLGILSNGVITATYPMYVGTVDKPSLPISPDTLTISLAIENKMLNLQRPTMRRYTSSDQNYYFPSDTGFHWVEIDNDLALIWG
ncbi:MAG TPA: hypothetical protein VGS10_11500 [Terracidiphilus sp.]|nr:hypothetical protein [Terracidiphilus sp.]